MNILPITKHASILDLITNDKVKNVSNSILSDVSLDLTNEYIFLTYSTYDTGYTINNYFNNELKQLSKTNPLEITITSFSGSKEIYKDSFQGLLANWDYLYNLENNQYDITLKFKLINTIEKILANW